MNGRQLSEHEHHIDGKVFVGRPLAVNRKLSGNLAEARKRDQKSIQRLKSNSK